MRKRRSIFVFIIIMIILAAIALFALYTYRQDQKKEFDQIVNSKILLKVDYGIIERESKLKETNALFKRVEQDNNNYLYITEDNIIFVYYLTWYYSFDPLRGYNVLYKDTLEDKEVEGILKEVKEKEIDSLFAKNKDDYITLHHDDKTSYITKKEMQAILQNQNIILNMENTQ